MKFWSDSFEDGDFIPEAYAAGAVAIDGFASNINPSFAWSGVPDKTKSFVLVCHDPDVPSVKEHVNKKGYEMPESTPRTTFFHWLLVDLPGDIRKIEEGEYSMGFTLKGKQAPVAAHNTRQGLNDYTSWSKNDPDMAGLYFGYDGPYPPFNDCIAHRYIFTLYALGVPTLNVREHFTGPEVMAALNEVKHKGQMFDTASLTGLYTMNARLIPSLR